jgi:phosphoglycolate phosphatase
MPVDALLFDKDGPLFDFAATWNGWTGGMIRHLGNGDEGVVQALATRLGYDLDAGEIRPDSIVIAASNEVIAAAIAEVVPDWSHAAVERHLAESAAVAPLVPATDLKQMIATLTDRGVVLGVMTNDAELSARAHLEAAGVLDGFAFVAGFDSGYGAKPDPDPLLAFCNAVGVEPSRAAMVGDSEHDLVAGRAAGMRTLGVLTGMARAEELHPLADAVLPDVGHIPAWLAN